MKKLLSLLMAVLMALTVISATPTVFAQEPQYTPVDSEFEHDYWGSVLYSSHVVKVGDWYYKLYETKTGEKKITDVCGYNGNETVITIPTELNGTQITGMEAFCLFSTTVKTIIIPREITGIDYGYEWYTEALYGNPVYINCEGETQLEEIIVESGNNNFWSEDGVLYRGLDLCFYPPQKKDREFVVPSDIITIKDGAIYTQPYLKSLTIPQSVDIMLDYAVSPNLENLYLYTTKDIIGNTNDYVGVGLWGGNVFVPTVKNGTIHCIDGSDMHKFYSKAANKSFYKKLVVLKDELVKKHDGKWYHFRGGVIDVRKEYSYIGNDLVKYKGKWFYTEEGIWTKKTRLFEYNGKWFYVKNGKWDNTKTDLIWYKNKWFYVENGKWDSNAFTLIKKNGKWFAVQSGKWYKGKAIIEYAGKEFYTNKGFVQFDYFGKVKVNGKIYKIKNGKVA